MNIIDHSSDNIRQIVPQDMSFLSDADQQITQALQLVLAALLGGNGTETIVLRGCEITTTDPWHNGTAVNGNSIVNDTNVPTYTYGITAGLILHGGRIYELEAATWVKGNGNYLMYGFDREVTMPAGIIVFEDESVAPSPVYGEGLEPDQHPHRRLVARVEQTTVTQRARAGLAQDAHSAATSTPTYHTSATDYIAPTAMKRIPVVGSLV